MKGVALNAKDTAKVTFGFNQPVILDPDAVSAPNARLSDLHAINPAADGASSHWVAALMPNPGTTAPENALRVNLAAVLDRRGSAGMDSSGPSVNYAVDTQRPTLAADGAIAIGNSELKAGDRASVTFTFSEPVTGFSTDAVSTPNASLSTPQAIDASGNAIADATAASAIWRATLTPHANTESAHNTISLSLAAISDTAGNRGQRVVTSAQYGVDTVAPVLASATVNGTQLLLGYTEGGTLDGAQMDFYAFSVSVDGADSPVSLQAVDAAAKTIALTLFEPVRQGQTVRIGYTDPTPGVDDTARAL